MTKLSFKDTGNDALDFSGSNVQLRDIIIHGAGDKAISVLVKKAELTIENMLLFLIAWYWTCK